MTRHWLGALAFVLGCAREETSAVVTVPVASASGAGAPSAEPEAADTKRVPHTIAWYADEALGRQEASKRHVATVVSFDAAWCTACREMDQQTFSSRAVHLAMIGVVAIRVDATDDDDLKIAALKQKYGVLGLPTIVFLDASGGEVSRLTEFTKRDAFLAALARAVER